MGALAFGNPLLLWGLFAAAVPLAIHLFSRRRSRPKAFAAVDFILRAQRRTIRQVRLRQILLLLARIAILAAIALALTRPLLAPENTAKAAAQTTAAATAIVVDASLSMRYRLGGKTLFERAQALGQELIQRLPDEASATLVICDGRPVDAAPPGFDRAQLIRRLSDATASHLPADVTACMSAAARALGESPLEGKRMHVITDLTVNGVRLDPPPVVPTSDGEVRPDIVFVDAADGNALPNLAVTSLAITPSATLGAGGYELVVTVRNAGDKAFQNTPIHLDVDGRVVTRGFVDIAPGGTARKVFAHRFDAGLRKGKVVLKPDALSEDDSRPFVLRVAREVRALVVDGAPAAVRHRGEAFFIDAALGPGRSGGRIDATFVDADTASSRTLSDFDVILLLNVQAPRASFAEALDKFVRNGGGLFLSVGDHVDPDAWNAAFGALLPRRLHVTRTAAEPESPGGPPPARLSRVDLRHPAFRVFEGVTEGWDTVRVWRYMLLSPETAENERILASLDDGSPFLVEAPRGKGRVLLYTSTVDRDWTDWPIRTSFLPGIQQLTAYLGDNLAEAPPQASRVGEKPVLNLPEGATVEGLVDEAGKTMDPTITRPGIFVPKVRLASGETADAPKFTFAAVLDPAESDTRRHDPEVLAEHFGGTEHASIATDARGALPTGGTPLWSFLLAAGVVFFFAEGLLVRKA